MTKQTWRAEKLRAANKRRKEQQRVAHYTKLLHANKPMTNSAESAVKAEAEIKQESSCEDSLSFWTRWAFCLTIVFIVEAVFDFAFAYSDGDDLTVAITLLGGLGFALFFALAGWWLKSEYKFLNPWVIYDLLVIGVAVIATIERYDAWWQDPEAIIMNVFSLSLATFIAAVTD